MIGSCQSFFHRATIKFLWTNHFCFEIEELVFSGNFLSRICVFFRDLEVFVLVFIFDVRLYTAFFLCNFFFIGFYLSCAETWLVKFGVKKRKMIFIQLNLNNFVDNFLSYFHYVFTFSLHYSFYYYFYLKRNKNEKTVQYLVVQITQL
jgi:hypothetical protein